MIRFLSWLRVTKHGLEEELDKSRGLGFRILKGKLRGVNRQVIKEDQGAGAGLFYKHSPKILLPVSFSRNWFRSMVITVEKRSLISFCLPNSLSELSKEVGFRGGRTLFWHRNKRINEFMEFCVRHKVHNFPEIPQAPWYLG